MFVIDLKQFVHCHLIAPAEPHGGFEPWFLLAPLIAGEGVLADEQSIGDLPLGDALCLAGLL